MGTKREKDYISKKSAESLINFVTFKLGFAGEISSEGEGTIIILDRRNTMCKAVALEQSVVRESQAEEDLWKGVELGTAVRWPHYKSPCRKLGLGVGI